MKVSFVVFLIFFSLDIVLTFYFLRTLESSPNAATGAIYALNVHGWVVYLDYARHRLLGALEVAQLVCAVLFGVARIVTLRR